MLRQMPSARWCWLPAAITAVCGAGCNDRAPLSLPVVDAAPPSDAGPGSGSLAWAIPVGVGAPGGGSTTVTALVPLSDGGVIVTGRLAGTVSFAADKTLAAPAGAGDAFVARYRSDQRLVWVRQLSAAGQALVIAGAAGLGNDEFAIVGWFAGTLTLPVIPGGGAASTLASAGGLDLFAARLASDGSVRWAVRAGGPGDDIARAVGAASNGAGGTVLAIAGASGAGAVFGPGEPGQTTAAIDDGPIFAARLSADSGALAWVRFAGGGIPSQAYSLAVGGPAPAVLVAGYANGMAPFGAGTAHATVLDPASSGRAFVARWESTGDFTWVRGVGGSQGEGDAVTVTASGAPVLAGVFEGQARFGDGAGAVTLAADGQGTGCFVTGLGVDGSVAWARRLAGEGVRPWRIRAAGSGDLLIAASFGGALTIDPDGSHPSTLAGAGGNDALFARLDSRGALRWAATGGGPGEDDGIDVGFDAGGFVLGAGNYVGPAAFGSGSLAVTLMSGTDGAGFVLRLAP
jgi:hypothetical protein